MKIFQISTNGRASSTGPLMHKMVKLYHSDMAPYAHLNLSEIFHCIKSIPFRPDPETNEVLMRPRYTMNSWGNGGDCDDKAIALASYAYIHKIPYRFIAARRADKKILHHVFCELYISNRWINADPTYSFNILGRAREQYAETVII